MSKRKDPKKFYMRKFLNQPGQYTVAAILAESRIEINRYGTGVGIYNTLSIADCNRNINLELPSADDADAKNSLAKLDIIISACQGLKDQIELGLKLRHEIELEDTRKKAEEKAAKERELNNA